MNGFMKKMLIRIMKLVSYCVSSGITSIVETRIVVCAKSSMIEYDNTRGGD